MKTHIRILVVDDEPLVLNVTSEILRISGFDVVEASSAQQAIDLMDELDDEIDLLITDFSMSEMNGLDLARELRTHYPKLEIVFTSGDIANAQDSVGTLVDRPHYIKKPFSPRDLANTITEIFKPPAQ